MRLMCTDPTGAIGSLTYGMWVLTSALQHTHEKTTRVVSLAVSY